MEKTTGRDQILAELVKEGGKELKEVILKIRKEEIIPQEWKCGIMCTIHKKGGVLMCVIIIEQSHGYVQHTKFWQIFYI